MSLLPWIETNLYETKNDMIASWIYAVSLHKLTIFLIFCLCFSYINIFKKNYLRNMPLPLCLIKTLEKCDTFCKHMKQ